MSRYRALRTLGMGPDGPVEEVTTERLGAEDLARRVTPVPAGPRRHRLRDLSESLARLGHAGIATVVDIVDVDDDRIEVLTVVGTDGSLADRVADRPLAPHEVRSLVGALAGALAAAHGVGVAHGHFVETNVLVRAGRPLLADFGLAEARTGRPDAHPFRTDVRDLAAMGARLLPHPGVDPSAAQLRRVLDWVADDPDATLDDLRRAVQEDGGPPPPPPRTDGAGAVGTTVARRRSAWALAATGALCLGLLGGAAAVLVPAGASATADERDVAQPAPTCPPVLADLAADVDGDGCAEAVDWQPSAAEIAYAGADGELLRFRVGQPGDALALGDWDCDGTATAAVVRSGTGETFVFDGWAAAGETLVAEAGPVLARGAAPAVVRDGGCDRLRGEGSEDRRG